MPVLMWVAGCGVFGPGEAAVEADRLRSAIMDLPGIESAEADSSESDLKHLASADVKVRMKPGATPAELESVLLGWAAAWPEDEDLMQRGLDVQYRSDQCVAHADEGANRGQLSATAQFLPVLCALATGAYVQVEDDWWHRRVFVSESAPPLDIDQLRSLPGAITPQDRWSIRGKSFNWGYEDD